MVAIQEQSVRFPARDESNSGASSVTELRFSCSSLKNPKLRDKCWVKGKIALLRKLAIRGEAGLTFKSQFSVVSQGARIFKGEFQGCIDGGRWLCIEQRS